MKIIDEKGKFLGKINLLDLLALIVILAAILFVGLRFIRGRDGGTSSVDKVQMTYTVLIPSVDPRSLPDIQKAVDAHERLLSSGNYVGTLALESFSTEDCRIYSTDETGNVTLLTDENRVNVVLTVSGDVDWTKHAAQVGSQEVRTGKDHILKTESIEFDSTVLTVEIAK